MTETVLKEIVHRAVRDGSFRAQLRGDPAKALAGITLTAEERSALTSGDPTRLTALGVDQRISKAFSAGLLSDASKTVIATDVGAGGAAFIDEGGAPGSMVIVGDPVAGETADRYLTEDEELFATRPEPMVETGSPDRTPHLWRIEQDLDAGSSLEAPADAPDSSIFRQVEEDLYTGGTVTTPEVAPSEGTQVDIVDQPTDY